MPNGKLMGKGRKDYRVTVRLDSETYQSLSEAVKQRIIGRQMEQN
jgi:hypothetical protein